MRIDVVGVKTGGCFFWEYHEESPLYIVHVPVALGSHATIVPLFERTTKPTALPDQHLPCSCVKNADAASRFQIPQYSSKTAVDMGHSQFRSTGSSYLGQLATCSDAVSVTSSLDSARHAARRSPSTLTRSQWRGTRGMLRHCRLAPTTELCAFAVSANTGRA